MYRLIVVALLLPGVALAQAAQLVDRIVAVVNKEVITLSELNAAVAAVDRQLRRQATPAPPRAVLERQMLERLILDKAQLQRARDTGIRIDDLQLDRAVQRIAENNKLTLAEFRRTLERDGVPFDAWRQDLREQIMLNRLREREVDEKIQVSDSELDLFLEEMKAHPERAEYNASHILVRIPEQSNPERIEEARARALKARAEAAAGADFARLAATYSDAPDALEGGSLGWRSHQRLPELFALTLSRMKPGEVTEPLRVPNGYQLLKLDTFNAAATPPFESVRDLASDRVHEQRQRTEVRKFLNRIRSQAIIEWKNAELKKAYDQFLAASATAEATGLEQ